MDDDYDYVDTSIFVTFWVYLAYFLGFVGLVTGYVQSVQPYIYYGLFFILLGLGLNISNNLIVVKDLLTGANIEYKFMEDSD